MSQVLDDLVELLTLEAIEENLFRGRSQDLGFRQLFGGQVLGQSLSAASQTVEDTRHVHSLHGYFLRPGDAGLPVVYQVDRVRDGGSFSTRRVTAIQKGKPIFTCSASFQYDEEGFEHQATMPQIVGPENLPSELELLTSRAHLIPEAAHDKFLRPKPIQFRPVTAEDPYDPKPGEPVKYVWFRADGSLPDIQALHRYMLAYASDFNLLTTSLRPHGKTVWQRDMQVASLDHSLWFHNDLRTDDWLLYAMDSPWAGNSRGFSRGSVFNRAGQLVASVSQEGLIRHRKDWA
ncbi:acyl-CoA thioesterase II [Pseudomonas syringae]|uniref:Acyl-CoA thioesterase 2 n=2 Tax=Pseudomonas syringae group TaxID=136849 RepID=A0A0W0I851_PSEVI|nr:acyl-CoA thioesterase II [Pseudomonas syringae]KTB69315.1 palmitoyl-CoA hydrolase [Pseudomonas viridiflava ICMP 13104]AHG42808.1 acyl-CoA thioesterase [Pseudomonas syringae CC1557]KTB78689.1 palmitoyl-CoA hydrolase [Pseudomonas syringae pv. syringae PD2766]MCF5468830.1 acyl-CoA thioesterase II [Pseudomonas syringae]MCF5472565.1 acyl-CoA thioesterase II [Pseudomonas syringae]